MFADFVPIPSLRSIGGIVMDVVCWEVVRRQRVVVTGTIGGGASRACDPLWLARSDRRSEVFIRQHIRKENLGIVTYMRHLWSRG